MAKEVVAIDIYKQPKIKKTAALIKQLESLNRTKKQLMLFDRLAHENQKYINNINRINLMNEPFLKAAQISLLAQQASEIGRQFSQMTEPLVRAAQIAHAQIAQLPQMQLAQQISSIGRQFSQMTEPLVRAAQITVALTNTIGHSLHDIGTRWPFLVCHMAKRALYDGDTETVKYFLTQILGYRTAGNEQIAALHVVLDQPGWQKAENPIAYVKKAVYYEVQRARKNEDGLWIPKNSRGKLQPVKVIPLDKPNEDGNPIEVASPYGTIKQVEDRIFLEQMAAHLNNPKDRQAVMMLAEIPHLGQALQEVYQGDLKAAKAARERIKYHLKKVLS